MTRHPQRRRTSGGLATVGPCLLAAALLGPPMAAIPAGADPDPVAAPVLAETEPSDLASAAGSGIVGFAHEAVGPAVDVAVGPDGTLVQRRAWRVFDGWDTFTYHERVVLREPSGDEHMLLSWEGLDPQAGPGYTGVALTPDGAAWVKSKSGIERVAAPGGAVTSFPQVEDGPAVLEPGAGNGVLFASASGRLGYATPAGGVVHVDDPGIVAPRDLASGPGGNVWFTNGDDRIGRASPGGAVTLVDVSAQGLTDLGGITVAPDGNAWFTGRGSDRIGRITPDLVVTSFPDPAGHVDQPADIVIGPGGFVYFTSQGNDRIGIVTPSGSIATFVDPFLEIDEPGAIAAGDEELWFHSAASTTLSRLFEATVPGAVPDLTAAPAQTMVTLRWAAAPPGGVPVIGHRVYRDGDLVGETAEREFVDTGLEPSTGHTYQVLAVNDVGEGPPASVSAFTGRYGYTRFPTERVVQNLAVAPDGDVWFTSIGDDRIGRLRPDGETALFADPSGEVDAPFDIAIGPDGNAWFTSRGNNRIGRIEPDGTITTFVDPDTRAGGPTSIAAGPDDAMWFTTTWSTVADGAVGRITMDGTITHPAAPAVEAEHVVSGPDGNLWFTSVDWADDAVMRVTPAGDTTFVASPGKDGPITAGPDGNVWFTRAGGLLARLTPSGVLTDFAAPFTSELAGIAAGLDDLLYVGGSRVIGAEREYGLWVVDPATGDATALPPGSEPVTGLPGSLDAAPDGSVWFVAGGAIMRLSAPSTPPPPPDLHVEGRAGSAVLWWSAPTVTGTEPLDGYRVRRDGQVVGTVSAPGAGTPRFVDEGLVDGAVHEYTVEAVNVVGPSDPAGPVTATVGDPGTGTITIVLETNIATGSDFSFRGCHTGVCGDFVLDNDDDPTRSDRMTAAVPAATTYTISQTDSPAPFTLSDLACVPPLTGDGTVDATGGAVAIDLAAGAEVTCTFTNTSPISFTDFANPPTPPAQFRSPAPLTSGPDGALWFADRPRAAIGRLDVDGTITSVLDPAPRTVRNLAPGADGNLWFTAGTQIGRLTPEGNVTMFDDPAGDLEEPDDIITGSDGNVWFADPDAHLLGRVTPAGDITTYADPDVSRPRSLTLATDGNVWFTDSPKSTVGWITPGGEIETIPAPGWMSVPATLTAAPQGGVWMSWFGTLQWVDATGDFTEVPLPGSRTSDPVLAVGDVVVLFDSNDNALRVHHPGAGWTLVIDLPAGLLDDVTDAVLGPDGGVWIGTGTDSVEQRFVRFGPSAEPSGPSDAAPDSAVDTWSTLIAEDPHPVSDHHVVAK